MKTIVLGLLILLNAQAHALTPREFLDTNQIDNFDATTNKIISMTYGSRFAAQVFKAYIEKNPSNLKYKKDLQSFIAKKSPSTPMKDVKIIVNMGLGWDFESKEQPYYVNNFISEIKSLGYEVEFISKYPYAPVEMNIDTIQPQLRRLFRDEKKRYILLSLCKGTPELLVAAAEVIKKDSNLKKKILGFVNMSGMMGGTFFSSTRLDMRVLTSMEKELDNLSSARSFSKFDRMQTVVSLPSMTKARIAQNVAPILNVSFGNIPAINISGALMSNLPIKNNSPLKMFINYNKAMMLYPYANDGFIDVTETRLPLTMFKNQKSIILNSSHLLTDGAFEDLDLTNKPNRLLFYKAVLQSLKEEI